MESIATGLIAGRHAVALASGAEIRAFPRETAIGSLCAYVSGADARNYQPANITFDLLPALDEADAPRFRHDKTGSSRRSLPARASRSWISNGCLSMSELAGEIERFLDRVCGAECSAHTVRNYASDLRSVAPVFFASRKAEPPALEDIDAAGDPGMAGDIYTSNG